MTAVKDTCQKDLIGASRKGTDGSCSASPNTVFLGGVVTMSRLMTHRTLLVCLLAALLALLVAGQQQRAFERIWFAGAALRRRCCARERPAPGRLSGRYRSPRAGRGVQRLGAVLRPQPAQPGQRDQPGPAFLELSLDGELLRRIPCAVSRIRRLSSTSGPASTWSPRSVANAW